MSWDASFLADTFGQALACSRRWTAEQARTEELFTALVEFHGRLQYLRIKNGAAPSAAASLRVFAPGSGFEDVPARLHSRHIRGLENILGALRGSADKFETHHTAIADLHAAMWQRQQQEQSQRQQAIGGGGTASVWLADASEGVVGAGRGTEAQRVGLPPPATCIQWMEELDALYSSELLLKLELLDSIDLHEMDTEALQGVAHLWALQPNLHPQPLERLRLFVESLTLDAIA